MGFNLSIGEAVADIDLKYRLAMVAVEELDGKPLGAPIDPRGFGEHKNINWPSYTAWHNFCETVGLMDVFYGDGEKYPWWLGENGLGRSGLLLSHPGCVELDTALLRRFEEARYRYVASVQDKSANFADGQDWILVRLDWLIWWTDWALKNCKYPSFANS